MNTTATVSTTRPIEGPTYDKTQPETRQPWLDFRRRGLTGTEIRDWGNGARRRDILVGKVTGEFEDLSHIPQVNHGNVREPVIADWIHQRFGLTPCQASYAHGDNLRHIASPDAISLDPFSGHLIVGSEDAIVGEIKTSVHDLTPGLIDAAGVLTKVDYDSKFFKTNYYTQIQWQMYVMNATRCLFVWEQHDGRIDPETGTYTPVGPPKHAWIMRDQPLIERLVNEVAPRALEEIDAAIVGVSPSGLPPASELSAEQAIIIADLLAARDAEAIAKAKKEKAWAQLVASYLGDGKPDLTIDADFAKLSVTTSTKTVRSTDEDAMRARAPKVVERYEALRERFTTERVEANQKLTVTAKKK